MGGGGGLYSTPRDYIRFCQMFVDGGQYNGKRILSEQACRLMGENQVTASLQKVDTTMPVPAIPEGHGFGLGFALTNKEKYRPDSTHYWQGITGPAFWIDPKNRLCVVIFVQRWSGENPLQEVVAKLLYR